MPERVLKALYPCGMRKFEEYKIWQKSQDLVIRIYQSSAQFPSSEKFVLKSQIRRAINSVPANIAEGCSRTSEKDFARFLEIPLGSVFECRSFLWTCKNLGYLQEPEYDSLRADLIEVSRMINGLKIKLVKKHS